MNIDPDKIDKIDEISRKLADEILNDLMPIIQRGIASILGERTEDLQDFGKLMADHGIPAPKISFPDE